MTKRNEKTSKRVATIAAKVLRVADQCYSGGNVWADLTSTGSTWRVCTIAELKALCASALTQAPDKKR